MRQLTRDWPTLNVYPLHVRVTDPGFIKNVGYIGMHKFVVDNFFLLNTYIKTRTNLLDINSSVFLKYVLVTC